jgi:hypothetical protein
MRPEGEQEPSRSFTVLTTLNMSTEFTIEMPPRAIVKRSARVTRSFALALMSVLGVAMSACGGGSDAVAPIVVGTLTITPAAPSVPEARTIKLSVQVKATNGQLLTDRAVKWSSASVATATISDSGVVTGVQVGSTTITATSEGVSASVPVNVTVGPCSASLAQPIISGVLVNGTLAASDCDFEDGTFVDAYSFSFASATTLEILMRSTAFDAYIYVLKPNGTDFVSVGDDNNSGGGTDARLTGSLLAGNYYILANSNVPGFGAYTLLFTSPFAALNAEIPLFASRANAGVNLRHVTKTEARMLRRFLRNK